MGHRVGAGMGRLADLPCSATTLSQLRGLRYSITELAYLFQSSRMTLSFIDEESLFLLSHLVFNS